MKKYSIIFLFLLCINLGFGQTKEIDSLKNLLLKSKLNDSTEIDLYIALTKAYFTINIDSTEKYSKISLEKALKTNNYRIVRAYGNRGNVLEVMSQGDSARFYYDKALDRLDKNEDKFERSIIYTSYSLSYQNSDRMDLALEYNTKAIELSKKDDKELCRIYFNQAILYFRSGIQETGKKYLSLAYESSKKVNNLRVEGASLQTLGYIYVQEKKLDSARVYLEKGLGICERTKSPETCFKVYSALGDLYIQMNLTSKANHAILKAKEYAEGRNKTDDILLTLIQLGELENKRKNYEKSADYFEEFESFYKSKNQDYPVTLMDAYNIWADTEYKRGGYKKSYELLNLHTNIYDSIFTLKNKELLIEANTKYETEKKDKEIAEQQLQLAENKTQFSYMAGGALLVVVSSILLWFLYQQRQKRKNQEIITLKREHQVQTLESLMEGEEKERFRIAKELHDGVNGDLSAIKFKLSSLLEMNNTVIKEAVSMIDKSCQQVRAISHNLVPPSLQDFNLIEALEEYCTNMNAMHSPEISFQQLGDAVILTKKQEANIYRIVQELVNNSIKHAEANEINVQISSRENTIQLIVEDNGKGYDQKTIKTDGIGLKNIQSRVTYLNATLDLVSNKQGTSTTIDIDINKLNEN